MKIKKQLILIAIVCLWNFSAYASAIITGNYPSLKDGDKVILYTNPYGDPDFTGVDQSFEAVVKDHNFKFVIPATIYPIRFNLKFKDRDGKLSNTNFYLTKNLRSYYLENDDNIKLTESLANLKITGIGAEKCVVIQQIQRNNRTYSNVSLIDNPKIYVKQMDVLVRKNLTFLAGHRKMISGDVYTLLEADIFGAWYGQTKPMWMMNDDQRKAITESLKDEKFVSPVNKDEVKKLNESPVLAFNDLYTWGIYYRYLYDSCYQKNEVFKTAQYYRYIKNKYSGVLRERLVTNVLFYRRVEPENNNDMIEDAITWVKDGQFFSILQSLKNQRMKGADAYNFTLRDENGDIHKMSEFKGKVVFIDFWFTGCGNCIKVKPFLEKIEDRFEGKPVVFLSINIDNKREQWLKGIQSGKYTTRIAMNLFSGDGGINSEISKYYSVSGGPTLVLIDKNGKLMDSPEDPRGDDGLSINQMITQEISK